MNKIFISHSTVDNKLAKAICDSFESKGIPCFIAPRDIRVGCTYSGELMRGIEECDILIFIASKDSFASQHVLREIERAVDRKMQILVYKIDDSDVPKNFEYFIMLNQWIDASANQRIPELVNAVVTNPEEENAKSDAGTAHNERNCKKHCHSTNSNQALLVLGVICLLIVACLSIIRFFQPSPDTYEKEVVATSENVIVGVPTDMAVGDHFNMGTYNGVPISWTVAYINENGECYVLADNAITYKSYDAPKSGTYNMINDSESFENSEVDNYTEEELQNARGCNEWQTSCIRTWLNSVDREVEYTGSIPNTEAFYDDRLAYHTEAGFLKSFTEEEMNRIIVKNDDYVFLPSEDEIEQYLDGNDCIEMRVKGTQELFDNDRSNDSAVYLSQNEGYISWLTRTPQDDNCYCVSVVGCNIDGNEMYEYTYQSAINPYGIRPAMWITND